MALIPLNFFVKGDGKSKRSHMTCVHKCGDACSKPVENTSDNPYFRDVARQALSRRDMLKASGVTVLAVGGAYSLAACSTDDETTNTAGSSSAAPEDGNGGGIDVTESPEGMRFKAVEPNTDDELRIPEGYQQSVLIAWGDPVEEGAPEFDFDKQTPEAQAKQFGFNNDFAGLLPIEGEKDAYVYVCSHEYTTEVMMFRGYDVDNPTREQAEIAWAAHGHSVVEVTANGGELKTRKGKLNRRITATTPMTFSGPAAGHDLLKTEQDPDGMKVLGTLNNCSGGVTPWGTILSGEENVDMYFGASEELKDEQLKKDLKRYGIKDEESYRKWEKFDDRFDVAKTPNEPNRFNWVVEIDPFDPKSTPVKHTALGRFKHEAGTIYVTDDGTVVCYSGDDARFEYVYKFVSSRKIKEGDTKHNMGIMAEGTLYVAKFSGNSPESEIDGSGKLPADGKFDGTGEWIKLLTASADGKSESHVDGMSPEEVCVYTRQAADKVGATKMDRPEDIEPSPKTGKIYMSLTNNSKRGTTEEKDGETTEHPPVDEANPRNENKNGQVIEMEDDHTGEKFTWNILLVCGDPAEADTYFGGFDKEKVSPISCPDNVAFDEHGNLWISTDGNALKTNDGLYAVAVEGERRGETKCFLTVPKGAETCGPIVEGNRVLVNVQHPGEVDTDDENLGDPTENPESHWPDGGDAQPRPAVAVIWKDGDGEIGM